MQGINISKFRNKLFELQNNTNDFFPNNTSLHMIATEYQIVFQFKP
jgi:hypothetical protein